MKLKPYILLFLFLLETSCSKKEDIYIVEELKEVHVWATTNIKSRIVPDVNDYFWTNEDKISLHTAVQSNLKYGLSTVQNACYAEFSPLDESLENIEGDTVYACYPDVMVSSANNKIVALPATTNIFYEKGNIQTFGYAVGRISNARVDFTFNYLTAFLELTLTPEMLEYSSNKELGSIMIRTSSNLPLSIGKGDTFDFSTLTSNYMNGTDYVKMDVDGHKLEGSWKVCIPILPQPPGTELTIQLKDKNDAFLCWFVQKAPETGFLAGNVYQIQPQQTNTPDVAYLGPDFTKLVKQLGTNQIADPYFSDLSIKKIEFIQRTHSAIPTNSVVVSAKDSEIPVYAILNQEDSLLTVFTSAERIEVVDASNLFNRFRNLQTIDFGIFRVSQSTISMESMFDSCERLSSIDVSNWETSNVVSVKNMFNWCIALKTLDVSNWILNKVTNMYQMFGSCANLVSLDVSKWDVSNVKNMAFLFYRCYSLTSLNVSEWDTANVDNFSFTFGKCRSLLSLDVSKWNVSKAISLNNMFVGCKGIKSLDVSNWDVSNVEDMDCLFDGCSSLNNLDVSKWNTARVNYMNKTFNGCENLTSLGVTKWKLSNVKNFAGMFQGCRLLTSLNLSGWDTGNINSYNILFNGCTSLSKLDISGWKLDKNAIYSYMFYDCCAESKSCEITADQSTMDFLLDKAEITYMDTSYFKWKTSD